VAAFQLHVRVRKLTIVPDDDSLGSVFFGLSEESWYSMPPAVRDRLERRVIAGLSGREKITATKDASAPTVLTLVEKFSAPEDA
jgi:hypothetical protein